MAYTPRRRKHLLAEMNVVPYIDVMLVLLIIFMVTSPMLTLTEGIKVELPVVKTQTHDPDQELPILLKITAQGEYLLTDGEVIDQPYPAAVLAQLGAQVLALLREKPERPVVVSADSHAQYGDVVKFMAYLEGNGVKVRLMTKAPEGQTGDAQ